MSTRERPRKAASRARPARSAKAEGKEQRRRELLAAASTVFAAKGYAAANVDDIVKKVGVARGTFYLYFHDKHDVFAALVDDFMTRLASSVVSIDVTHPTDTPVEQLRANLVRVVELALSEPVLMRLALHDAASQGPELAARIDAFYGSLHQLLDESLTIGQRIGLVREGDRRVMVAIGLGGLKEMVYDAARGELAAEPGALVDEMMRFLRSGLLASPRRTS